jgi:hypothetical protein
MTPVFAGAFYFIALLNKSDRAYARALQFQAIGLSLVTTSWVLTEVGDALCARENRDLFLELLDQLNSLPDVKIIPFSEELFERGIELFRQRADKDWPLTDCISFVAMKNEGVTEALTGDKHFEQAGFRILLK